MHVLSLLQHRRAVQPCLMLCHQQQHRLLEAPELMVALGKSDLFGRQSRDIINGVKVLEQLVR